MGCETPLYLVNYGKKVDIIEMLPEILPDVKVYHQKKMLSHIITFVDDIRVHTGTK